MQLGQKVKTIELPRAAQKHPRLSKYYGAKLNNDGTLKSKSIGTITQIPGKLRHVYSEEGKLVDTFQMDCRVTFPNGLSNSFMFEDLKVVL